LKWYATSQYLLQEVSRAQRLVLAVAQQGLVDAEDARVERQRARRSSSRAARCAAPR
jgi:hypothetical protein